MILSTPDLLLCPLCIDTPIGDGHVELCPSCDATWQAGTGGPGQWVEHDAPRCRSTIQPHRHRADMPSLTWRCALADEHSEWHRTPQAPGLEWNDNGHAHTYLPGLPTLDCTTGEPCECDADIPAEL